MNQFVQSDIAESDRVQKYLAGERHHSPAFLTRFVPSTLFSITFLAPQYGIEKVNESTGRSKSKVESYTSLVWCQRGKDKRVGAGRSRNPVVAKYFAWRNAIKALMTIEELIREEINHS